MTKRKPPEKHLPRRGPPSLLADAVEGPRLINRIVKAARETSTWLECALASGVSDRALFAWRERGEAAFVAAEGDEARCPPDDLPFMRLYLRTAQARIRKRIKRRQIIDKAAERDWRAAAWAEDREDRIDLLTGKIGPENDITPGELEAFVQETIEEVSTTTVRRTTRTAAIARRDEDETT